MRSGIQDRATPVNRFSRHYGSGDLASGAMSGESDTGGKIEPVTLVRLATVMASGFKNEIELAEALLGAVERIGRELLDENESAVSEDQKRGIRRTLNDSPITFAYISALPLSTEQKANLLFMVTKLGDDFLSLGSVAMLSGNADTVVSVMRGAQKGGKESTKVRRTKQRKW